MTSTAHDEDPGSSSTSERTPTSSKPVTAPKAPEIELRMTSRPVRTLRPVIFASIQVAKWACRVKWRSHGVHHLLSCDHPVLLAANHSSHLDTEAILDALPNKMRSRTIVAAAFDYFGVTGDNITLRRRALQLVVAAGWKAYGFERQGQSLRSVRATTKLLRRGWNLLMYPEGTRSRTGEIGEFKPGIGVLARLSHRPVVPVHVSGGLTVLPHGTTIPRSGEVVVRFGPALHFPQGGDPAEFATLVEDAVRDLASSVAAEASPDRPEVAHLNPSNQL